MRGNQSPPLLPEGSGVGAQNNMATLELGFPPMTEHRVTKLSPPTTLEKSIKISVYTGTYTQIFLVALFTIVPKSGESPTLISG